MLFKEEKTRYSLSENRIDITIRLLFALKYDGVKYKMYRVGLETGYAYPIYEGSKLVACIMADKSIFNELNLYHIYALNKSYSYISSVFGLYLDACIQLKYGPLITSPSFIAGKEPKKEI